MHSHAEQRIEEFHPFVEKLVTMETAHNDRARSRVGLQARGTSLHGGEEKVARSIYFMSTIFIVDTFWPAVRR